MSPQPNRDTPLAPHIASLDGIRAVSFIAVFVSHVFHSWTAVAGDFGVTVFFFLSGFLITTLMRIEYEDTGSVDLGHFWLRRALRILPPFYLVLLVTAPLTLWLYPPGTLRAGPLTAQMLHIANYWIATHGVRGLAPGTEVYWSLAVEEHFYLLFPWLYLWMQRRQLSRLKQAWVLWGLCALVLLWRYAFHFSLIPQHGVYMSISADMRLDEILFGCALGVWGNPVLDKPWLSPGWWQYLLLPVAVTILALSFVHRSVLDTDEWYFTLQGSALTFVFTAAIRFHRWRVFRWLNFRPVAFLGVLSYSMYLIHNVLLHAAAQLWPDLFLLYRAVLALIATIAAAWLIYLLLERPCARLRRRLTASHTDYSRTAIGTGGLYAGKGA